MATDDGFVARHQQRVVGVLGGGQLGRMLIEAAHPMGQFRWLWWAGWQS